LGKLLPEVFPADLGGVLGQLRPRVLDRVFPEDFSPDLGRVFGQLLSRVLGRVFLDDFPQDSGRVLGQHFSRVLPQHLGEAFPDALPVALPQTSRGLFAGPLALLDTDRGPNTIIPWRPSVVRSQWTPQARMRPLSLDGYGIR